MDTSENRSDPLRERSLDFAVKIVAVCKHMRDKLSFLLFASLLLAFPMEANAWEVWWNFVDRGLLRDVPDEAKTFADAYETLLPGLYPYEPGTFDKLGYPDKWNVGIPDDDCRLRNVGKWDRFSVLHVFWPAQHHQSILLREEDGLLHFLWIEINDIEFEDTLVAAIWKVDNRDILTVRRSISGSGGFWDETYWILDSATGQPRLIDLKAIHEAEKQVLPPGGIVGLKSGILDMQALTYWTSVWMPGDGNCCPTGGSIDMSLAIEGPRVVVTDARWTPPEQE